ncbi:MAG: 2OG-Fe(II) oxygenase family protein [Planctomycetota bacterium]|jgi:isopenicillin N synthase-like dioxygenase
MTDPKPDDDIDLDARNQDFISYEQVEKKQDYRLAEAEGEERFDEDYRIKVCDMSGLLAGDPKASAEFVQELGTAMRDIGFAILTGHGVAPEIHELAERSVAPVFKESSTEEKLRYRAERFGSINQGYFPIEETSDIHPDLVEGWVFCRRAFDLGRDQVDLNQFWPRPEYEAAFRPMMLAHEKLFLPIMQSVLRFLGVDPHLYDEKLSDTNFALRLNYYPPLSEEQARSGKGRLLGHEDVTLFTMLPAPRTEGLQVLNRENFSWVRVQAPEGSIILNTGDYMQRISNDILPSTTHRVSQPRDAATVGQARVSFPTNVYVREEEMLEVLPGLGEPKYEPIKAINFHTHTTAKYYGDEYSVDD